MIRARRPSAGFTLIEAIMVIVITGILAGIVAVFITNPVQGYVDAVRRAELTDAADVALRRITRDVRRAVPNTLRLKNVTTPTADSCGFSDECYIEFVMTKGGGLYRADGDGSTGGDILNFISSTNKNFDALGPMPEMEGGDRIVVYNLGENYSPADAYSGENVATLAGTGAITTNPVVMETNPFASQSPPLPSPSARFQVVDKDELVVRYTCKGGELRRIQGCTMASPSVCSGTGALLAGSATAEPKATCEIEYKENATGRNGLLYLKLKLTDTPSGESVELFQQIHVDNAP